MTLSRKTLAFFILIFALLSSVMAETQDTTQKTAGMEKPGLEGLKEFHGVLHSVWHDAYPNKDYKGIRESVSGFKKKMEIILKAELPGFYRERREEFENKREALAQAVVELEKKAKGNDNQALLIATEDLHTAYAYLAFFFAPRVKELEEFHLVLYPLWHQALPDKDFETIRDSAPDLTVKMEALMEVKLSKRFKDIEPEFVKKRKDLKISVDELIQACNKKNDKKLEEKLIRMHTAYRELDGIFDND